MAKHNRIHRRRKKSCKKIKKYLRYKYLSSIEFPIVGKCGEESCIKEIKDCKHCDKFEHKLFGDFPVKEFVTLSGEVNDFKNNYLSKYY